MTAFSGSLSSSSGIAFANKVGVIPIIGDIEDSTVLLKQITDFTKDKSIKAVILRLSPLIYQISIYRFVYKSTGPNLITRVVYESC